MRFAHFCLPPCLTVVSLLSGPLLGQDGPPRIFAANKDGTNVELLVDLPMMQWHGQADWSPDGKLIVVDVSPEFRNFALSKIYVHAIGGPFKGQTKELGSGNVPRWSPDGSKIAFHLRAGSPDGGLPGIWVMNDDGTDRKWVAEGLNPRWLADGKSLLLIGKAADGSTIESINVDGTGRKRLVRQAFDSLTAAGPSADGKWLTFIHYPKQAYDGELCVAPFGENQEYFIAARSAIARPIRRTASRFCFGCWTAKTSICASLTPRARRPPSSWPTRKARNTTLTPNGPATASASPGAAIGSCRGPREALGNERERSSFWRSPGSRQVPPAATRRHGLFCQV